MSEPDRVQLPAAGSLGQRMIASVLRASVRLMARRTFRAGLPVDEHRRRVRQVTRLTLPPRGCTFSGASCGGVPGEWALARGHEHASQAMLYLHGGGYVSGSPVTHRAVTGHLAAKCRARVFAADYRLAPEHPFPAAVDDAVAAYRGLLAEGVAPDDIVIAGDSAGGGLAVATALRLRDLQAPLPRALAVLSPWTDLTLRQLATDAPEIMLAVPWLHEGADAYVAGADAGHPLVSPVHADLRGLPPTLIQVGGDEVLLNDSRRLFNRLRGCGVAARLEEYAGRWHVFHVHAGLLADADRALDGVARFVALH